MTDDELVELFFPCDRIICGNQPSGHSYDCAADYRHHAKRLAAAVREAVMASAEVCRGRCGGRGHVLNSLDSVEPTSPCPTCSGRGILFGRGVVEGET